MPTAVPDRIVINWTGDPARTQAVTWRTDVSVTEPRAEIAPMDDGPMFVFSSKAIGGVTESVESDLGQAHFHTVEFTELKPSTRYLYRVGDGVNWSEWIAFRTAAEKPEPFSFIYFGDAQNGLKPHWSRVFREAFATAPKARFIIHAGDLINDARRDEEWGEWFYAGGWVHAMLPSIATPGNHEYSDRNAEGRKQLSRHWRPQFAFPTNGPKGLEETTYFIDYQGVRLVSLNSNDELRLQADWLDKVLSDNPNRWTVLTFHHPIYSASVGRINLLHRAVWKPIIDKHAVDLVLQGHDHSYARSGLIGANLPTGANVREPSVGTVYVVSVSGPKMYKLDKEEWMRQSAEGKQLFQVVSVDGDKLTYKAYTAAGRLYDAFELHKDPRRLVELAPTDAANSEGSRPSPN